MIDLFSCEALGENRALIGNLLLNLYETLRIRNVLRAKDILEKRWARTSEDDNNGMQANITRRLQPTILTKIQQLIVT
jgi:hypothetical protein